LKISLQAYIIIFEAGLLQRIQPHYFPRVFLPPQMQLVHILCKQCSFQIAQPHKSGVPYFLVEYFYGRVRKYMQSKKIMHVVCGRLEKRLRQLGLCAVHGRVVFAFLATIK